MSITEQILLGLALAMDCFSVSIASGMISKRIVIRTMLTMAILFGVFQAMMPAIGWVATIYFKDLIEPIDHWIAFGLLAYIGGKMIADHFKEEEEKTFSPNRLSVILIMAVATSIDALAVGVSFTCMGMTDMADILCPITVIGIMSTLMSILGTWIGARLGKRFRFPAELVGGIILIGIGIKVVCEHLG